MVHSSKAKSSIKKAYPDKGRTSGPAICPKKVADPCKTNNGGCDSKRKCTSTGGVASCGNCPAGFTNDGAKGCKAKPKPKPTSPAKPKPTPPKPKECYTANTRYFPKDDIPGQGRTTMTAAQCHARCKSVAACAYFSRWNNGGCHLSSSKAKRVAGTDVVSGPRSCATANPTPPKKAPASPTKCTKAEYHLVEEANSCGTQYKGRVYLNHLNSGYKVNLRIPLAECAKRAFADKRCSDHFAWGRRDDSDHYVNGRPYPNHDCGCGAKGSINAACKEVRLRKNTVSTYRLTPTCNAGATGKSATPSQAYAPKTAAELYTAIDACMKASDFACTKGPHGPIGEWDVTAVTNMNKMFGVKGATTKFTGDISKWDVSKVTNMFQMFFESSFKGDISKWDVSKVTNMQSMFQLSHYEGDITMWDVRNVKHMEQMFENAQYFWYTLCGKWKQVLDSGKCKHDRMFYGNTYGTICSYTHSSEVTGHL